MPSVYKLAKYTLKVLQHSLKDLLSVFEHFMNKTRCEFKTLSNICDEAFDYVWKALLDRRTYLGPCEKCTIEFFGENS